MPTPCADPVPPASAPGAVLGVDGARGSWVTARHIVGTPPTLHWCAHIDDVVALARTSEASVVGIDMPIGLPSSAPRASDALARSILGPRRSCLFPTPMRAVLDAVDHADAVARSRAACGKGISVQAWNLVPAIAAVRAVAAAAPDVVMVEVHPETTFTVLAGAPLPPKRTPEGGAVRRGLLEAVFGGLDLDRAVAELRAAAGHTRFAADDVLDALAACWSAGRLARGEAMVLGDGVDDDGFALTVVV